MNIEEKVYEIIDKYGENGTLDECIEELENYLSKTIKSNSFSVKSDTDVFASCGLDIYYIMAAWTEPDGLHLCGSRLTRC